MADKINLLIESMMPDMLYLIRRKIFSKEEGKAILKNREDLEYSLAKTTVKIHNYLKAIQFEYDLERKRKENNHALNYKKSHLKDFSIVKRIIQLFDRVTNKFKYNISLWNQYLVFCYKIKSKKNFFKAISNALRFLPNNLKFWLLGAYYEMEVEGNPIKGRNVLLRAGKSLGKNDEFWKEFIKFELSFLRILIERKKILVGGDMQEDTEDFLAFESKAKNTNITNENEEKNVEFIMTIYENAKQNIPLKQEFPYKVLDLLSEFSDLSSNLENLKSLIENDLNEEKKNLSKEFPDPFFAELSILLKKFKANPTQPPLPPTLLPDTLLSSSFSLLPHLPPFSLIPSLNLLCTFLSSARKFFTEEKDLIGDFIDKMVGFGIKQERSIFVDILKTLTGLGKGTDQEVMRRVIFISYPNEEIEIWNNLFSLIWPDKNNISQILDKILNNKGKIVKKLSKSHPHEKVDFIVKLINLWKEEGAPKERGILLFEIIWESAQKYGETNLIEIIQEIRKNGEGAEECFKKAEIGRAGWAIDMHLAYIDFLKEKNASYDEIKRYFEKVVTWLKENEQAWINWIKFELSNGKANEAHKVLEKARLYGMIEKESFVKEYKKLI